MRRPENWVAGVTKKVGISRCLILRYKPSRRRNERDCAWPRNERPCWSKRCVGLRSRGLMCIGWSPSVAEEISRLVRNTFSIAYEPENHRDHGRIMLGRVGYRREHLDACRSCEPHGAVTGVLEDMRGCHEYIFRMLPNSALISWARGVAGGQNFSGRLRKRSSGVRAFFVTVRSVLSVSPGAVRRITPVFEASSVLYIYGDQYFITFVITWR